MKMWFRSTMADSLLLAIALSSGMVVAGSPPNDGDMRLAPAERPALAGATMSSSALLLHKEGGAPGVSEEATGRLISFSGPLRRGEDNEQGSGQATSPPKITGISPSSGPIGATIVLTGERFTSQGNELAIRGRIALAGLTSPDGTSLTFVLSAGMGCSSGSACPIKVRNANGIGNAVPFKVTSGDHSGKPTTSTEKPDLAVLDIYDDHGKLSVKIGNIGTAAAPSNTGSLYIWIDGQLKWTYGLSTLYSQSFLSTGGTIVVQPQILSGQHKIKAFIDPNNVIAESNENNNILEETLTFSATTSRAGWMSLFAL